MTVTGEDGCPVECEMVTAMVNASGKKRISVFPTNQETDENGYAVFTISARKKTGEAIVTFQAADQSKSIVVAVVK
ncbi:MAG: hypothetical protein AABY38_00835 [Planctomycetota bacterium]|jgi:hypothetical protein